MVVTCPKCKTKLKVAEEKLKPEGSRLKCPKCTTVLLVKKPGAAPAGAPAPKRLNTSKIIIAHAKDDVIEKVKGVLGSIGYTVIVAKDGVEAMMTILKDLPFMAILDVALPKIYGFELCKRIKARPETKEMKIIFASSIYDKTRYRRNPASLYGADDYIDEHLIENELMDKVETIKKAARAEKEAAAPTPPTAAPPSAGQAASPPAAQAVAPTATTSDADVMVEKARRLARTVLADIYLYGPDKVNQSIRNGSFKVDFANDLKEGMKLYDSRIPKDVKSKGDFFEEALVNFINDKKKALGI